MKKNTIVAAGGLVTDDSGRLLMIWRRGVWDLPKGKLDDGESIEHCAVREVEEETGVTNISLDKLVGITYHEYFDTWTQQEVQKETHWYAMRATGTQNTVPQHEEDIEKIEWVDPADLPKYLQGTYRNIAEIISRFYPDLQA